MSISTCSSLRTRLLRPYKLSTRATNLHTQSVNRQLTQPAKISREFSSTSHWRPSSTPVANLRALRRTFASGHTHDAFASYRSARTAIWTIIGLNTAVFGLWQYSNLQEDKRLMRWVHRNFTLSTANLQEGRWWTIVTAAFSHTMLFHFGFNMVALHAFGSIMSVIPGVGGVHIVSLCLGSAVAGSAAWLYHRSSRGSGAAVGDGSVWATVAASRAKQHESSLGASGMVMGAGAAATCLMPRAPMIIFPIPFAIPLWVVTGLYFAFDSYMLNSGSRIGHSAHLGGAFYGFAYHALYLRRHGGVWQLIKRGLRR